MRRGTGGSVRERIVAEATKTLSSRTGHYYYLAVPVAGSPLENPLAKAPFRSDCSQWAHAIYLLAGAPSPGLNTGAMLRRGKPTNAPRPGDIMVSISHCEIFVGGDKLIGHGSAPIDYGSVSYWRARGMKFRTYLDD